MYLYSAILFAVSFIFIVVGVLIYRGNVNLIHAYHRSKVKDNSAYGKAFGKALLVFPLVMLLAGAIALFGELKAIVLFSIFVLLSGITIGIALIVTVQRKYNDGVF